MRTTDSFSYPVKTADFQLWSAALMPVFLILYDAQLEEAYWLHIQDSHHEHKVELQKKTVQLHIPQHNILGVGTIRLMRERKERALTSIRDKG